MSFERESDMYAPLKRHFESLGYAVQGEVKGCDLCACKDDDTIIVELKKSLNIRLLCQGTQRQKLSDLVYLAVPYPASFSNKGVWKDTIHLLRRLELGLIFIRPSGVVSVMSHPAPFDRSRSVKASSAKRVNLFKELEGRSLDANVGGSTGKKLFTAYREVVLKVAILTEQCGVVDSSMGSKLGLTTQKMSSILRNDHYGWFYKVDRRNYTLSQAGKSALVEYERFVEILKDGVPSEEV